ncbi:hypothetical protein Pla110_24400 [Polystyrenella longa]|uniref:Uncharacterized protein n=1 Tax=Polystyrenella longa TaxID=2528007 RepID=A0A518CNC0_9PLAN|nr:YHYH domain-containing protein [Polystyrenella longa]QDU80708.1 hypothetical protein Pla110_24400 [Polystyrenella longa]
MNSRAILYCSLLLTVPVISLAHPGRTDSNGGHNDRKNGGYHYHSGGSSSNGSPGGSSGSNVSPLFNSSSSGLSSRRSSSINSGRSESPSTSRTTPADDKKSDEIAVKRLRLAKSQLKAGIENLQEIAETYSGTEAGAEAAFLSHNLMTEFVAIEAVLKGKEKPSSVEVTEKVDAKR